jgi:hypothetical protein
MNFTTELWLSAMLANEIEETEQNIKNYTIWERGCNDPDELPAYAEQISNLHEYKDTLTNLLKQVKEGTLNV